MFELNYFYIIIYVLVDLCLVIFLVLLSYISMFKTIVFDKISAFECGFEPFEASRSLNINFFVVCIMFLIFDVEIIFLIPWVKCLGDIGSFGFLNGIFFILILVFGFIYEWKLGMLNWNKLRNFYKETV